MAAYELLGEQAVGRDSGLAATAALNELLYSEIDTLSVAISRS